MPGGTCFIFAGRRYAHRCIAALEDSGFTFKDMLAWEKDNAPHRAQRLSAIYERRGDSESASRWEGWRVANLRPLFEEEINAHDDSFSNIISVKTYSYVYSS